jgi:N-acetyl-anhydromuramyl-L-alanine amidase AmpD
MGGYADFAKSPLPDWYATNAEGQVYITIPKRFGAGGIRTPNFVGHPARNEPVVGEVQGRELIQYDYTPQQYQALAHLTAALCQVFPKIKCDYPRDGSGKLITHKLPDAELKIYEGVLGHYHIQTNKTDPGPALNWDYVINHARILKQGSSTSLGHMRPRN